MAAYKRFFCAPYFVSLQLFLVFFYPNFPSVFHLSLVSFQATKLDLCWFLRALMRGRATIEG